MGSLLIGVKVPKKLQPYQLEVKNDLDKLISNERIVRMLLITSHKDWPLDEFFSLISDVRVFYETGMKELVDALKASGVSKKDATEAAITEFYDLVDKADYAAKDAAERIRNMESGLECINADTRH